MASVPQITTTKKNYEYSSKIFINTFEYAPINCGDIIGFIEFYDEDGKIIATTDICADSSVPIELIETKEKNFLEKIKEFFR